MSSLVGIDGKSLETADALLERLVNRGRELVELDRKIGVKIKEIEAKYNKEMEAMGAKAQAEVEILRAPLLDGLEKYRAEVKKEFGITDGEKSNVVEMFLAIRNFMKRVQ